MRKTEEKEVVMYEVPDKKTNDAKDRLEIYRQKLTKKEK